MSENVTPSRMNLQLYKQKIVAAKKGHELLDKKCKALKTHFRKVMIVLLDTKKKMGDEAAEALLLLAKAQWAAGEFQENVKDAVKRATIRIDRGAENVAGVFLPILKVKESEDSDNALAQIGMDRGGAQIERARECFRELLDLLIEISTSQAAFVTLDETIKVTSRRVNALQHVVIPRFERVRAYIQLEIDEQAREEFFRIKKVLDNKKKVQQMEQEEKDKRMEELRKKGIKVEDGEANRAIFEDDPNKDEDVIF